MDLNHEEITQKNIEVNQKIDDLIYHKAQVIQNFDQSISDHHNELARIEEVKANLLKQQDKYYNMACLLSNRIPYHKKVQYGTIQVRA